MAVRKHFGWVLVAGAALLVTGVTGLVTPLALNAQATAAQATAADKSEVTFTRDIAPILQRSCQNCHRPGQVAPMSLITYEEARPWARSMKARTAIRDTLTFGGSEASRSTSNLDHEKMRRSTS